MIDIAVNLASTIKFILLHSPARAVGQLCRGYESWVYMNYIRPALHHLSTAFNL